MSNSEEIIHTVPFSLLTKEVFEKAPLFRMNDGTPSAEGEKERKAALRSDFAPMVIYLFEHGEHIDANTLKPEDIVQALVGRSELELEPPLVEALKSYQAVSGQQPIDWNKESFRISLEGRNHPIYRLRQRALKKMSPEARSELTLLQLSLL